MRWTVVLLLGLLGLAGCGGRGGPHVDRALAGELARQADAVAQKVRAGDACAARTHALALQRQTIAAINAGRIPQPFQEPLQSRANELADELGLGCLPTPRAAAPAPPPPPASPPPVVTRPAEVGRGGQPPHGPGRPHERRHGHGHGRGEGHGHGNGHGGEHGGGR